MTKTQCRCDSCSPGDPDPHATEAFRHECEVRAVVKMDSHVDRRRFLELVAKHRGKSAAERLRLDAAKAMGIVK